MSLPSIEYRTELDKMHYLSSHDNLGYELAEDTRGVYWLLYEQNPNPFDRNYGVFEETLEEGPYDTVEEAVWGLYNYIERSPQYSP